MERMAEVVREGERMQWRIAEAEAEEWGREEESDEEDVQFSLVAISIHISSGEEELEMGVVSVLADCAVPDCRIMAEAMGSWE
jgi:hypothetical protein